MNKFFYINNNFNTILKLFREKNKELNEIYTMVSDTVSPKGQYSNYRKKLKELDDRKEEIMPFLGKYINI